MKDHADTNVRSVREADLETKLAIADKVEGELRKTISILEDVNRKQATAIESLQKAIERKDEIIAAQNKLLQYRGERLAERGY